MCQSLSQGGKRCEYADALANVRRKARYRHRDLDKSLRERKVSAAVRKFKEENRDLVQQHLPARQPFFFQPDSAKKTPKRYTEMFRQERNEAIRGLPKTAREEATRQLKLDYDAVIARTSDEHDRSMRWYAMTGFESANTLLRRNGYAQWAKENAILISPHTKEEYAEEHLKPHIKKIDEFIAAAPVPEEPRKVYRYFRVPDGISPGDYISRYFRTGEGFEDKGFMSTSADPEFVMATIHKENGGKRNKHFVVMEILTKKGASLQNKEVSRSGDIQSLEKEVLLPRRTKFRIAGAKRSQRFEYASDRNDLAQTHWPSYYSGVHTECREGQRLNLPVIQLIDEELIE